MKPKNYLLAIVAITLFLSVGVVVYGKSKIKKISFNDYQKDCYYSADYSDGIKELKNSYFNGIESFFIKDDSVSSVADLVEQSDYVFVVKNYDEPLLYGTSIINNLEIKQIIKGDEFKIGEKIQVYDLIYNWKNFATDYFMGSTPLMVGEEYLVFLKDAPKPTIKNTYIFDSFTYGHIRINSDNRYLLNYENYTKKVDEIAKYDHVFSLGDTEEDVLKYENIVKEALELVQ